MLCLRLRFASQLMNDQLAEQDQKLLSLTRRQGFPQESCGFAFGYRRGEVDW